MKNIQFENDIDVIPTLYNQLEVIVIDGERILKGNIDIIDNTGKLWDTYEIEIRGSNSYPKGFPKLFEVGDSFPKIASWHTYEFDDKSCCIDVTPNEILICKNGISVVDYIQLFVIPYLANQTFRKREGYYLYGEYSHGILGRIEFYQNKLKAKNTFDLMKMIDLIIGGFNPDRTAFCPVCNKIKFRKCHRDIFKELQSIKNFLDYDRRQLIPFFISNPDYKLPILL